MSRVQCDIVMPDGWRFYTCDASIEDGGFSVLLKRDKKGCDWWFSHTDEQREIIPLYAQGTALNLHDAVNNAVLDISGV